MPIMQRTFKKDAKGVYDYKNIYDATINAQHRDTTPIVSTLRKHINSEIYDAAVNGEFRADIKSDEFVFLARHQEKKLKSIIKDLEAAGYQVQYWHKTNPEGAVELDDVYMTISWYQDPHAPEA